MGVGFGSYLTEGSWWYAVLTSIVYHSAFRVLVPTTDKKSKLRVGFYFAN